MIKSAHKVILKSFVPYNLRFDHISHQDVIDHHTTAIARELMCDDSVDTVIFVTNGTYVYI